jgi:hypothetical protein
MNARVGQELSLRKIGYYLLITTISNKKFLIKPRGTLESCGDTPVAGH